MADALKEPAAGRGGKHTMLKTIGTVTVVGILALVLWLFVQIVIRKKPVRSLVRRGVKHSKERTWNGSSVVTTGPSSAEEMAPAAAADAWTDRGTSNPVLVEDQIPENEDVGATLQIDAGPNSGDPSTWNDYIARQDVFGTAWRE